MLEPVLSLAPIRSRSGPERDDIRRLLFEVDQEFVPPLSGRATSMDQRLAGPAATSVEGPWEYWDSMLAQPAVSCRVGDDLAGFLAYRPDQHVPALGKVVSAYVTTLAVARRFRGHGLAEAMYRHLVERLGADGSAASVATRTWSTNDSHLAILRKLGFDLVKTIEHDRAEDVGTVYYLKHLHTAADHGRRPAGLNAVR